MVKEFTLSDEWRILRNAVSAYYKSIEKDICSVIYENVEKKYEGIYEENQIKKIQHNEICNSISIIYNSIFKKFFNINSPDESFKSPKWQDRISCEDLTRLILLLQESKQIVKKDRGDYTYIEAGINEIKNEEFLSLNFIDNDRGFEKCNSFPKEEIENKNNFKTVFEKYLNFVFNDYVKEDFCRPLKDYLKIIFEFTDNNSFSKAKHKKNNKIIDYFEDIIEEKGLDYDGRNIVKVMKFDCEGKITDVKYLADGEEVDIDGIIFKEEEKEINTFNLKKFIENNTPCSLKSNNFEQENQQKRNLTKKQNIQTYEEEYRQPELFDSFEQ